MGSSGTMSGGVGTGGSGPPTPCLHTCADFCGSEGHAGEGTDEAE